MVRRPVALFVACGLTSLALMASGMVPQELAAANKTAKTSKKPIRNPKFDPTAEKVDLFAAKDAGQVTVKLVPKDAMGGTVLVENKTDKPLTIKVPEAVVGVSIHSQFGGGGMGGGMMGGGGMGGGGMGGGGGGQAMGGGMGGGGMGGGGMGGGGMGMGGGMFSIPPESVVSVAFNSVCLEHGKAEPSARSQYTLIPVAKFNSDPVLFKLLGVIGTGKVDPQAAQAAAWHLSSKMTFQELAEKTDSPLGGLAPSPYFSQEQLLGAQNLLAFATQRAADEESAEKTEPNADEQSNAPRTSRVQNN